MGHIKLVEHSCVVCTRTPSEMEFKPAQLSEFPHLPHSEPPTAISSDFPEKTALEPNARWITRSSRPRLSGLLPAALVIFTTLGFVGAILVVLLGKQCVETQGGQGIIPVIKQGVFYTKDSRHDPKPNAKSHLWVLTLSGLAVSQGEHGAPCQKLITLYRARLFLAQPLL